MSVGKVARVSGWLVLPLWLTWVAAVHASEYVDQWGPALGSRAPLLAAPDQEGNPRDLSNLAGERGLLLVFSRSASWGKEI